jgi:CheY-like chemotaxis protein
MPEMSGIEICSTLRNRMDLLMSDTRKIAIVSTQFQISHRDDIRANLSQVIKEYEEDRVWVLATIDRWKTSNAVDDRTR